MEGVEESGHLSFSLGCCWHGWNQGHSFMCNVCLEWTGHTFKVFYLARLPISQCFVQKEQVLDGTFFLSLPIGISVFLVSSAPSLRKLRVFTSTLLVEASSFPDCLPSLYHSKSPYVCFVYSLQTFWLYIAGRIDKNTSIPSFYHWNLALCFKCTTRLSL